MDVAVRTEQSIRVLLYWYIFIMAVFKVHAVVCNCLRRAYNTVFHYSGPGIVALLRWFYGVVAVHVLIVTVTTPL